MSFLFDLHTHIRSASLTRRGATMHPDDVPTGTHKEYPRMERIALPAPEPLPMNLGLALATRHSSNVFKTAKLNSNVVSTLFGHALGVREGVTRHYPSGGALFPIETYLISARIEGCRESVFHYHPSSHSLEVLWELPRDSKISKMVPQEYATDDNSLMVFTALWERSSSKYGDLAYSHALIEAGHMAQNILLATTALDIPARPVAGVSDALVHTTLDVNPKEEQCVYTILL